MALKLPASPRTSIFRAIVTILKSDPQLQRVVKQWIVWDGSPDASKDLNVPSDGMVVIRLTPSVGPMSWWSPDTMIGDLAIHVEATIRGLNADDVMNLQHAIEQAIYKPHPQGLAQEKTLRDMGAETGQPEFAAPMDDSGAKDRRDENFFTMGVIKISVRRLLNH